MQLIDPNVQAILDPVIERIISAVCETELDYPESCTEGNLNYIIYRILSDIYTSGGYSDLNDAIGVLECTKHRFLNSTIARNTP